MICTGGHHQEDWSADYRLYSKGRVNESILFTTALKQVEDKLPPQSPLVVAIDDTLVRKSGKHIDGVKWRRDPLGPPFQTNLVLGQRYIQFSAAWPLENGESRMVPIGFHHAPTAPKPPANATQAQLQENREQQKQRCLNNQAIEHMVALREQVDPARSIVFCGDGSYTNKTVMKNLPRNCTLIGRVRKDAKLCYPPLKQPRTGRKCSYGPAAPTPEALRKDDSIPWQNVQAFAAGKQHSFKVKILSGVLWRKSGANISLSVVVIAPLSYHRNQKGKLLYRQPAYLICTDPTMAIAALLQYYLWRWGIEGNFRDEKTLLGAGQAHVRTAASNQHLPAVIVASYALLWIAALRCLDKGKGLPLLQPPKWRNRKAETSTLPSTGDLLRLLRFEMWGPALKPSSFDHFANETTPSTKSQKLPASPAGALFYAA